MTKPEQVETTIRLFIDLIEILNKKGGDYANEDVLSNFKLAGNICGIGAEMNCLNLIATKVARLGVLLNGAEPNNESIEDSIKDLINYGILLYLLRHDSKTAVEESNPVQYVLHITG